jgi:hypothetical protein
VRRRKFASARHIGKVTVRAYLACRDAKNKATAARRNLATALGNAALTPAPEPEPSSEHLREVANV